MKKILSFLLLATMLIGCMAPCAFAVDGPALMAESVEKLQGADKNVNVEIALENNPGTYSMQLVVYYNSSELALGDADNAFADSIFGADSTIGTEMAGTNTKIRNYIPSDLRSTSKGFIIDLYGEYDEELEDTAVVTGDGVVVTLPFEILADDFDTFDYTVVVAEALDEAAEEYELAGATGTVTYAADPFIGIYDEFTAFFNPAEISIVAGTESVDVDLRLDNNPGLWATRVYIVYPEALTLDAGNGSANVDNNTGIFLSNSDLITGIPDLELDDERQVQGFKELMVADPSIVRDGYVSTTLYFERQDSYEDVYTGNGVLCTLHFNVDPTVAPGTDLDITLYYNEADFLFADTDEATGEPIFISYYPTVVGSTITVAECEHANTTVESADVTCTVDGYERTICTDCGTIIEETITPSKGHTTLQPGSTVTIAPTCTEPGSQTRYCDVCGEINSYEELPAYGHDYDGGRTEVTLDPTCTTAGVQTIYCYWCDEEFIEEEIPALDHPEEYREATGAVEPTCTEAGNTGKVVCNLCGETVVDGEEIPATGHVETTLTGAVDATCTEDGYTGDEICNECEEIAVAGETIPALDHPETTLTGAYEATCTVYGYTGDAVCDLCGETVEYGEVIPALNHPEQSVVGAIEPTCTDEGYTGDSVCDLCGETIIVGEAIPALGHGAGVLTGVVDATCTDEGYTGDTVCGVCGEVLVAGEVIRALGHGELELVGASEATCTAYGHTGNWVCPVCEEVVEYGNVIPSLNHPETTLTGAADATCTAEGYTGDEICDLCGETVVAGEAIAMLPHDYVDGFCSVCGEPQVRNGWGQHPEFGWFYADADGNKVTNKWMKDSKGWCYLGADGYMVSSKWVKDSKGWCYVGADGYMVTNKWVKDSVTWCYIGADGYCVTNKWVKDSYGWCYLGADGRMVSNAWAKDSYGWCYLGEDGYMVSSKWVKDSKGWCYIGADGYMLTNRWVVDGSGWCYVDGSGYCVTGTKVINGVTYKFNSNGNLIG